MSSRSPRSLRRAYVEWVEEQLEEFKDRIPRAQLLQLADEVVTELRVNDAGQYQLTEILLCNAMDRRILRMLKLPGYRAWCAQRAAEHAPQTVISFPLPERFVSTPAAAPRIALVAEEDEPERLACVG
jgi:hypothetical protein